MIVTTLKNHFNGKTTIVVGNWCINGCQTFHKDDAQHIFEKFSVPTNMRREVINLFSNDPFTKGDYYDLELILREKDKILSFIKICDDADILKKYARSDMIPIRLEVAKKDIKELNDILKYDVAFDVRNELARHSEDLELLEYLAGDTRNTIRENAYKRYYEIKTEKEIITNAIVFENHFDGKTTLVIGDWCINGCRTFHRSESKKIFDEYDVPLKYRDDVMKAFSGNKIDYDALVSKYQYLPLSTIVAICDDRDFLKKHVSHSFWLIRAQIAKKGISELDDILCSDNNRVVKLNIAKHSTSKHALCYLLRDENETVREDAQKRINEL